MDHMPADLQDTVLGIRSFPTEVPVATYSDVTYTSEEEEETSNSNGGELNDTPGG